jgi:ribosome-associated protein
MTSLELAIETAKILNEKKAIDLKVIRIADVSVLADYFVITTGTSNTHVKALADELDAKLSLAGRTPLHTEGYRSNTWVLLDYGSVVVHLFTAEARAFYDLDRLWSDGQPVDLTDILK